MSQSREPAAPKYASRIGFTFRHVEALPSLVWTDEQAHKLSVVVDTIEDGGTAVLLGPRGTGKTQAATQIAYEYCARHKAHVQYELCFAMLQDIKKRAYDDHKGSWGTLAEQVKCDLLVVDELQEMRQSEDDIRWMTALLDQRYARKKASILIANLVPQALPGVMGPSVMSRLEETGQIVVCDWGSFRKRPRPGVDAEATP